MSSCFQCKSLSARRVDRVFPRDDTNVPRRDALQHLSWYCLSHARKLPKISRYLARRIKAAEARGQHSRVSVGLQIFDELIRKCHTEARLFLQQYLLVLLDLLTSEHPYHAVAVESFERFAGIDADTPVYRHMCADFIRVFSSLCWCTEAPQDSDEAVRMSGLRGLAAIVEKDRDTASESALYDEYSLGQVIPALLFNVTKGDHLTPASLIIRRRSGSDIEGGDEQELPSDPPQLASRVLQIICEHATLATAKAILRPLFGYLADFGLWEEREDGVASYAITLVLSSLEGQLVHIVCTELVRHLNSRDTLGPLAKRSIIKAISTVCASVSSIPFTYVLDIYNAILAHLRKPLPNATAADAQLLEDSIVAACADVASTLPPMQKTEILITIFTKVATTHEAKAKHQLIECARGAANTLEVQSLSSALPDALLKPLLQTTIHSDEDVQTSSTALLFDLLQCPLEVSPSHAITTSSLSAQRSNDSRRSDETTLTATTTATATGRSPTRLQRKVVRLLDLDGIRGDAVQQIATLEYNHPESVGDVEKEETRRRPQLRPIIRVDSADDVDSEREQRREHPDITFAQLCPWRTGPPAFNIRPTDADVFKNIGDMKVADIAARVLKHRSAPHVCSLLSSDWKPITASPLPF
ncbi:hypothetical protein PTSG_10813 [Salpingoeca rosetta]|uniref:Uncharacterized protein n=1 Tax=Salpingoeca rosetta (strain ATCC 50818 / BSB-021) TaxID=946362 RepID=F2UQ00_SALR5|nr:uncharacterized protein PTSG_10813 [Salpingoeca rosetta]EGD79830.1 hypothetical protein PTSG_10813 [Salpingoeca rosetta]|eukprot:XP_004988778.1 hypothetical protein PTSG_10813 [Salpingoeca rosetta]